MRVTNGTTSSLLDWGPGGASNIPFSNTYMKIANSTGYDLFLPDNSTAEKQAVFNNFSVPNATKYVGQYGDSGILYNNTANITSVGPCWTPFIPGYVPYPTSPSCPSGYTDAGDQYANGNPNNYEAYPSILPSDLLWQAYQYLQYGCPSGYNSRFSVRQCYL